MTVEIIKADLLDALPRFYNDAIEVDGIMQANAVEINRVRNDARTLLAQLTVSTATFGLSDWERVLALPQRPNQSVGSRRARILAKLLGSQPATLANMLAIVNAHSETKDARITELPEPGTVIFEINASNAIDFNGLFEDIATYIPAHLSYRIATSNRSKVYVGSVIQSGASITIYPYRTPEIMQQTRLNLLSTIVNAQTTTIYPKGDE